MAIKKTGRRRVSTDPAPGSDPTPQDVPARPEKAAEDRDDSWGDKPAGPNDDRLKRDVPPHW